MSAFWLTPTEIPPDGGSHTPLDDQLGAPAVPLCLPVTLCQSSTAPSAAKMMKTGVPPGPIRW